MSYTALCKKLFQGNSKKRSYIQLVKTNIEKQQWKLTNNTPDTFISRKHFFNLSPTTNGVSTIRVEVLLGKVTRRELLRDPGVVEPTDELSAITPGGLDVACVEVAKCISTSGEEGGSSAID